MNTNPKRQVSLIIFSTLLAGFSLASILNFTDPASAGGLTFAFFYLSLLLLVLGLLCLIGLGLRQWLSPGLYVANFANSFRQALLISLLLVVSFWLLSLRLLFWWVELSLILFLSAVEAFLNLKV